jgi:hypothetical protein
MEGRAARGVWWRPAWERMLGLTRRAWHGDVACAFVILEGKRTGVLAWTLMEPGHGLMTKPRRDHEPRVRRRGGIGPRGRAQVSGEPATH